MAVRGLESNGDPNVRAVLVDFGLKWLRNSTTKYDGRGLIPWLAPEAVMDPTSTPASDVYAFGMVLVELLTYNTPWHGTQTYQILTELREGNIPEVPRNTTRCIRDLLLACTRSNPL